MKLILNFVYIAMTMRTFLFLLCTVFPFSVLGATGFEVSPEHKEAYELIIALRFDEGRAVLEQIKTRDPENVLVYHIENYIDFIGIFISEEEDVFKIKEKNKEVRLAKLKSGDSSDPYFLFSQAEVHLQWAMTRVKFKEYFKAAREVNKAINLLQKNQELFPDFISNKKSLSLLHAVAGTIPDKYKGLVSLLSKFSGSIDQGLDEITEVLEKTDETYLFRKEALAIKGMISLHLKNQKEVAWNFLSASELASADNPMAVFLMASSALQCGKNEEAIRMLSERTRSPRFFPFYYLDLMLGSSKLSRLDRDADIYIQSYIDNFEGLDYYKDAYRKLAWHSLVVLEDEQGYLYYMSMCLKKGNLRIDEDRAAYKEAKMGVVPNRALLKARILFDGGYYQESLRVLDKLQLEDLSPSQKGERSYRSARALQELGSKEAALKAFLECLEMVGESREYYYCASALQAGVLYEEVGDYTLAESYFKRCLKMQASEYRNSLHQKAKSGLDRLSTK